MTDEKRGALQNLSRMVCDFRYERADNVLRNLYMIFQGDLKLAVEELEQECKQFERPLWNVLSEMQEPINVTNDPD